MANNKFLSEAMFLLLFFTIVATNLFIPVRGNVSKCYGGTDPNKTTILDCDPPVNVFCGTLICNYGNHQSTTFSCAAQECGEGLKSVCQCIRCDSDLCNSPNPMPMPITTAISPEIPPVAPAESKASPSMTTYSHQIFILGVSAIIIVATFEAIGFVFG